MAKLNKQEKTYMVRRIRDEVEKVIGPFPELSCTLHEAIKKATSNQTLTLKPHEELLDTIAEAIVRSGNWTPSIDLESLINIPREFAAEQDAVKKSLVVREAKRQRLLNIAQPIIDSVNLGESVSGDLASFIDSIRADD